MVADIQLLQGKIIDDPDKRVRNISKLIEELALEILSTEPPAAVETASTASASADAPLESA